MTTKAEIRAMRIEAKGHQGLRATPKAQKKALSGFSLRPSDEVWTCWHLDFGFLVFRTQGKYISVILSHVVW